MLGAEPEPWTSLPPQRHRNPPHHHHHHHHLTLLMSHGAPGPGGRHLQRQPLLVTIAANQAGGAAEPGVGAVGWFVRGLPTQSEVNPTLTQQLAWPRRAPQGRAPSGSVGKRRTLVSWIRLTGSLEESKRRGARGRSGVTWPPHPSSPPLAAAPMRTPWCISSGALFHLLVQNPGGETYWVWPHHRVPRARSRRSGDAETKAHCPESSTWATPSPAHLPNAGAPSSELPAEERAADPKPAGHDEAGGADLQTAGSEPQKALTP